MATLEALDRVHAVSKVDAALGSRLEVRCIYASPRFRAWAETTLPTMEAHPLAGTTHAQELDTLLEQFCAGDELKIGPRLKSLEHKSDSVWELKTDSLRLFGWFTQRDYFICYVADDTDRIKQYRLYEGYITETVRFRDQLDLDQPKFVPGDDPHAVVSNYAYP